MSLWFSLNIFLLLCWQFSFLCIRPTNVCMIAVSAVSLLYFHSSLISLCFLLEPSQLTQSRGRFQFTFLGLWCKGKDCCFPASSAEVEAGYVFGIFCHYPDALIHKCDALTIAEHRILSKLLLVAYNLIISFRIKIFWGDVLHFKELI